MTPLVAKIGKNRLTDFCHWPTGRFLSSTFYGGGQISQKEAYGPLFGKNRLRFFLKKRDFYGKIEKSKIRLRILAKNLPKTGLRAKLSQLLTPLFSQIQPKFHFWPFWPKMGPKVPTLEDLPPKKDPSTTLGPLWGPTRAGGPRLVLLKKETYKK